MNRRLMRFLALALTAFFLVVSPLQPALSIGLGDILNPGNILEQGKKAGEEAIFNQIAKSLGEVEPPLKLDQRTAYPKVKVENFKPQKLEFATAADWLKPLPAGDYWIDLIAYCTQWSIHRPGGGMAYKLAPLQGKAAEPISALFLRGTIANTDPSRLQAMAWRIQSGIPLSQWSEGERQLAHQLIPEYENQLNGDFLEEVKAKYQSFQGNVSLKVFPSFDEALGRLGKAGQFIASVQRARKVLLDRSIADDQLPDLLYERTDNTPRILPDLAQSEKEVWNEVKPGIYASFVVQGGNLAQNRLNFRVTPQAVVASLPEGVKVAGAGDIAIPSNVSALDPLVIPKANPGSMVRTALAGALRGRRGALPGTFLPEEAEFLPVFGQLAATLNIGYAIGQYGAQALVTFMKAPANGNGNCKPENLKGPRPDQEPLNLQEQALLNEARSQSNPIDTTKDSILGDIDRIVALYGGNRGDWFKATTRSVDINGRSTQVHWLRNRKTGQNAEFKFKVNGQDRLDKC